MTVWLVMGGADCQDYTYVDSVWDTEEAARARMAELVSIARPGACEEPGLQVGKLNEGSKPEWAVLP